jgi:hypothetical protein
MAALALVVLPASAGNHPAKRPRAEIKPDMASVYVARPRAGLHVRSRAYFFANEQFLGLSRGNDYFWTCLPLGKYILWSLSENLTLPPAVEDVLPLEFEAGRTDYIRQMRVPARARIDYAGAIELVDPAVGDALIDKCQTQPDMTDEQRRFGEGLANSF